MEKKPSKGLELKEAWSSASEILDGIDLLLHHPNHEFVNPIINTGNLLQLQETLQQLLNLTTNINETESLYRVELIALYRERNTYLEKLREIEAIVDSLSRKTSGNSKTTIEFLQEVNALLQAPETHHS